MPTREPIQWRRRFTVAPGWSVISSTNGDGVLEERRDPMVPKF